MEAKLARYQMEAESCRALYKKAETELVEYREKINKHGCQTFFVDGTELSCIHYIARLKAELAAQQEHVEAERPCGGRSTKT